MCVWVCVVCGRGGGGVRVAGGGLFTTSSHSKFFTYIHL